MAEELGRHRTSASDVPPEGETAPEGVRRGERQSRALAHSIVGAAGVGAVLGAALGIVLGFLADAFAPERLVDGPTALVVVGVVLATALSGAVIGVLVALARWDGAEQREIDARIGGRGARSSRR